MSRNSQLLQQIVEKNLFCYLLANIKEYIVPIQYLTKQKNYAEQLEQRVIYL